MTQGGWDQYGHGHARVEGTGMAQAGYDDHHEDDPSEVRPGQERSVYYRNGHRGQSPKGPQPAAGYGRMGSARDGYGHEAYEPNAHGASGYDQATYAQTAYGQGAYGQAPYGAGAYPPAPVSRGQRIINIIGAIGSVGLVAALGWWGWDLAVRDARGVPVVRALEGPMRIAPEDPGGAIVDHQGLSVNDVAAIGGAAAPSDRLVLAPAPVELTLEDGPGLNSLEGQATAPGQVVAAPVDPMANMPDQLADPEIPVTPEVSEPDAVALALAEALGLAPEDVAATAPAPVGEMARSPRPKPRPAGAGASAGAGGATAGAPAASAPAKPNVIEVASLTPGTRLVQFGAYNTREDAEAEWMRLATRFTDLMAAKSMVVQSAESGGQTFWRLRAHGFENEQESRRFCAALEAEGAKCIPVAHR